MILITCQLVTITIVITTIITCHYHYHNLSLSLSLTSSLVIIIITIIIRFSARGKAALLHHARSLAHLRAEQVAEARRESGGGEQPGIADIFTVTEASDTEQAESSETGEHFIVKLRSRSRSGKGQV